MRKQLAMIIFCASCGSTASRATDRGGTPQESAPQLTQTAGSAAESPAIRTKVEAPTPEVLRAEAERLYRQAEAARDSSSAWQEAALALTRASKSAGDEPREREFLRSALAAWQEVDRLAPPLSGAGEQRPASKTPRALPDWEISRMAVLARLAQLAPAGDPELAMIEYRKGRILYRYDHHKEAALSFRWVLAQAPQSSEAEYAAQLLLDLLVLTEDWVGLQRELTSILANKRLLKGRDELKERFALVRHQVDRKSAEKMAQGKDFSACAEAYLSLYGRDRAMPGVPGDELLYNASVCLERSGQTARAIEVLRKLVKASPKSPLAARAKERAEALGASR